MGASGGAEVSGQAGFSVLPNTFRILFPVWIKEALDDVVIQSATMVLAERLYCVWVMVLDLELKVRGATPKGTHSLGGSQRQGVARL